MHEDLRIQKTKAKLFNTFMQMLSEQSVEKITVNELCHRAGVRRATFYAHYEDKTSFCYSVVQALRRDFDKRIWKKPLPDAGADYYVTYAVEVVEFLDSNEKIVTNLLSSSMLGSMAQLVLIQNYKDTLMRLQSSQEHGMNLVASADTTTAMLAGGVTAAALAWLNTKKQKPKEVFIEELSSIITKLLEK